MKKSLIWIGIFMILPLILIACGDNDDVDNPPQNTTEEEQQQAEETNTNTANENTDNGTNTGYSFTNFELEADYTDTNDALDVEYEKEQNEKIEASYRDQSQEIDLHGDAAMEELDQLFSSFTFDEDTPDDEVLNTVIEAFNIPEDAKNIELEIQFNSGTEKEYHK
ncbi:YusW family protein [Oceanobacillus halophilus]|uniref:YusW-like protein n=1 Tax=Oceanobacillus halophilus TaxID=930130 RepID=A0A494ZT83_9BACI|nr:YusW family protein [Oceanobacillus halophilus]RKQ28174.1 hypothetical protein D8M06_19130 [Oceanobacillus halophilus]